MTQEEKQLLLRDLCGRLLYGVKFQGEDSNVYILDAANYFVLQVEDMVFKPYLRPMSSMTEKEKEEFDKILQSCSDKFFAYSAKERRYRFFDTEQEDFMNAHHFDYRGLIEKGLALEAPEDMYII